MSNLPKGARSVGALDPPGAPTEASALRTPQGGRYEVDPMAATAMRLGRARAIGPLHLQSGAGGSGPRTYRLASCEP